MILWTYYWHSELDDLTLKTLRIFMLVNHANSNKQINNCQVKKFPASLATIEFVNSAERSANTIKRPGCRYDFDEEIDWDFNAANEDQSRGEQYWG